MARGSGQRPVRGFRPGKEPPALRKQRARQQLGGDASWSQKMLIDALADRTPEQARAMMRRSRVVTLSVGLALTALGILLYMWTLWAGILVHVLAAAAFLFWMQLGRKQRDFEAMAEMVSGRPGGKGGRKGKGSGGASAGRKR